MALTPEMLDRLSQFRTKALATGIPPDDLERWIGTAVRARSWIRQGTGRSWVGSAAL